MWSIIIPAKNSGKKIEKNIKNILKEFKGDNIEIIVVCNNCTDNTYDVCLKFSHLVKILNFPRRIGKGGAIIEGLKVSRGEIVGYTDSDGAYDPNTIRKVLEKVSNENYDVSIASRWVNKKFNDVEGNFWRKVYGRLWIFLVKNLLGLKIDDTQAGLKFFKRKVLENVIPKIEVKDFSFDVELLLKIHDKKYSLVQVPVKENYTRDSTINLFSTLNMLFSLTKIWLFTITKSTKQKISKIYI